MRTAADVRVTNDANMDWLVWLDSILVGRFPLAGEALALAAMLECNPKERARVCAA